ncbi:phage portal protein [Archangium primigenium]|uniref:phage portal protein n=1 Tax=[Archangium] primigenium TaxID=2792470 RepID=UPI00195A04CB|nr:phage portal protein [Archangium primigenium]MBM7117627.1 phage portal protein [Archangium primigenium]
MASLRSRFKAALTGLLLGPSAGRPLVHTLPLLPFSPRSGSRQVLAAYRENAWLQAVVDTVAEATATPRWRVLLPVTSKGKGLARSLKAVGALERTRDGRLSRHKALARGVERGDLVELHQHELLNFLDSPHPLFTGRDLRKLQQVHLDLVGETFLYLRRTLDDERRVAGYEVLPPHCVHQTPTDTGTHYVVTYNRAATSVLPSEIVWLKRLDPENPYGRGVGRGLAMGDELDTAEALQVARKATFLRGGLPAAVVGIDEGGAGDDRAEEIESEYQEKFNRPEAAGRVWFVNGKVSLSQIQQDFRALQMDETEKGLRDFVRQCFNVSPELLGDLTSANRSTSEEAKYTLAEYAVLPRLEFQRNHYQLHVVPRIDPDALLEYEDPRPQSWERTLAVVTCSPNEGFTWNEVRALAGFAPDPSLNGRRPRPLPGAMPVQDKPQAPKNPPPPRGPAKAA